jgi:hypothetical protein
MKNKYTLFYLGQVYHKTDVLDLQTLPRDNFGIWASNGSCGEEI